MSERVADVDPDRRRPQGRRRWTSFVAAETSGSEVARGLHEASNPRHRLRVEHDDFTLLIHLSDEDGHQWTTIAVDRATRRWAVAQDVRQSTTSSTAYEMLYPPKAQEDSDARRR